MSERGNRMQSKMRRMQEVHSHPVDIAAICCPDHVYEICSLFQPQGRTEEIVTALLSLESLLDTRFLLDSSDQTYERKKALIIFANEYALWSAALKDVETAFSLLGVAEMIMGSLQNDATESGLRTTTLMNLSYVSVLARNYDQAITTLDEADRISKAAKDVIGCASVKVTKSALFMRLKSYQEAYIQAQHAAKLTEDLLPSIHEPELRKTKILLTAAKLNMTAASEFISGSKPTGPPTSQIRNELIRIVEQKGEIRSIKEYDESPIYREEAKAGAVSNIEDDLGSFLDGVQRWDKVRSIENPSFVVSPEPKSVVNAKFPTPVNKLPQAKPPPEPEVKAKAQPKQAIPPLPLASKQGKPGKALVLPRMPNSALPVIPTRISMFRGTHIGTNMKPIGKPDYALALDELVSLSDETVKTIKTMEGTSFFLQCSLQRQSLLKLSAIALTDRDEAIPSESIDLEQLKSIVNMLGIAEVLPSDFPSKWISTFSEAAHFFILPFFQITTAEDTGKKKVELWSISPGILEAQVTRGFLAQQRRLVIHQTSPLSLRLCLTDVNSEPSSDSMISMDISFSEDFRTAVLPLHDGKQSWVSFKPLPVRFLDKLDAAIEDYENELKKSGHLPILLVRTQLEEGVGNTLVQYVFDNEPQRRWDIVVRRIGKEPLVLTVGFPYCQIVNSFGVVMKKLDTEDRRCLAALILDLLKVQFASDSGEEETESVILMGQVTTIASYRTFIKHNKGLLPVTLSLIGLKDRLLGVRATIFGVTSCLESGCFLSLSASNYSIQQSADAAGKKKKKYNKLEGLSQVAEKETSLMTLLREKGGWETLLAALKVDGVTAPSLYLTDKGGRKKWFGRLEAIIPGTSGKTA